MLEANSMSEIFRDAQKHRKAHECGGYPYENGDVLTALVAVNLPERILELGTGLGYTAACLAVGNKYALIDTVD